MIAKITTNGANCDEHVGRPETGRSARLGESWRDEQGLQLRRRTAPALSQGLPGRAAYIPGAHAKAMRARPPQSSRR